jgi:hypothetical protein
MATSIAEVIAAAKDGLWQLLSTTPGLTDTDGVRVASAAVSPDELAVGTDVVELGSVIVAPPTRPDLQGRGASPTISGWVTITRPLGNEVAVQTTRERAAAVMGLVERTVMGNPSANGTIAPPGPTTVAVLSLSDAPGDFKGQAVRRTICTFSISWTSHTTL